MAVGGSQEPGQPLECDPVQRCLGAEYRNETVQDQGVDAVDGRCHVPHANAGCIPNYGERRRAGEAISTAFTESAVNQLATASKCAGHRAVRTCCCRYAPESSTTPSPTGYRRWYPNFTHTPDHQDRVA